MLKTYRYRLLPGGKQIHIMEQWLEECRWLFNYFLAERKNAWEQKQRNLNYHAQATSLPTIKNERPTLSSVHSQVLQNVAMRIDLAFKAFLRRIKAGEKPGYPRFRGKGRYDSFTFPQSGFRLEGDKLNLSKIGELQVILHRPLEGQVRTCTIKRSSTGKWYVTFSCHWEPVPLPKNERAVGVHVGVHSFATLSTGEQIENPEFVRQEEKALTKAQRKLSKAEKGTPERKKCRKIIARICERITNRRHNFVHQLSRKIVNSFGVIAVKDLNVNRMVHNHCVAKSIMDAAWSGFFSVLAYKAEWAGRKFMIVNPVYTNQDCSKCGHRQQIPLAQRIFQCPCCGLEINRDYNASLNILRLGLQSLG